MVEECKSNASNMVDAAVLEVDTSDFTIRTTMLDKMLTSEVGAGRATTPVAPDTLGILQLLQGRLITRANMDRMLIKKEQILVALVNQLAEADMKEFIVSLMKGVISPEGLAAIRCWKNVMTQYSHRQVPQSWRLHTMGCLDKDRMTYLDVAIRTGHQVAAASFLESTFGAFACRHVARDGKTALIMAVQNGMGSLCLKMLEMFGVVQCGGFIVEAQHGDTALIRACDRGMEDVALKLLEMGPEACNAGHANKRGFTALMAACFKNMKTVALKMLEMGATACNAGQVSMNEKTTALLLACGNRGMTDVALKLLEMGAKACNAKHANKKGYTALIQACRVRMGDVALKLLDMGAKACAANHATSEGITALLLACRRRMKGVALKLLEMGAEACNASQVQEYFDSTALMTACEQGPCMRRVALKLLDMGEEACNAKYTGRHGNTALSTACRKCMEDVALKLLNMGAKACSASQVNKVGNTTAFMEACRIGEPLHHVALKLLDMGAEAFNAKHLICRYHNTALIWACCAYMEDVALKLLEKVGAEACNARFTDDLGYTALMWACKNHLVSVAIKLLSFGSEACRSHHVNTNGMSALHFARVYPKSMREVIDMLNGMDIDS